MSGFFLFVLRFDIGQSVWMNDSGCSHSSVILDPVAFFNIVLHLHLLSIEHKSVKGTSYSLIQNRGGDILKTVLPIETGRPVGLLEHESTHRAAASNVSKQF